ncbi:Gfo/Idh/MocA family oxidoreductase [Phyllobacterium sp. LjRoot231]|uniref:Gfo/Idh/MocA family protein n=1 Tax=Phyllobacterium sp. LjRoot231 TaxID=3342289 RepID=UPI003ECFA2C8
MLPISLAIVGVGKIAHDQHLPSIAGNPDFQLVATTSRSNTVEDIPNFATIEEMLAAIPSIDAVSLCMPPQFRYDAAYKAIAAGKHVFLEKPPGATLSEVADLEALAIAKGVSLFASWHSRYAAAVEAAKSFLASASIASVHVVWKEDVRHWHPNQDWIWQAGGLGVFDPGINALSIITHILPTGIFLRSATLEFPENKHAPIAADLYLTNAENVSVHAEFDWRQVGEQTWDIIAETSAGQMVLAQGGSTLTVNGAVIPVSSETEYAALYSRFADLIKNGKSDVDLAPLRHVADSFMLGKRVVVASFHDLPGAD